MSFKKHISFPSIEQFRNIIANVNRHYNFIGLDDQGEAIYDTTLPKPVLTFIGTIKLHGTNFGVCYNITDGLWAQSRENIITPQNDNAGSAFFVETNRTVFINLFEQAIDKYNINPQENTLALYGEWVGKGIQKGVAISNLDKSMFIIGLKISPHPKNEEDKVEAYWLDSSFLKSPEHRIFNIRDYKTYFITIDFNNPQEAYQKILELTTEVDNECPVGKEFGIIGIGEGIVFSCQAPNGETYRFKSKGEKHSNANKETKLKPVDDVKLNNIINVVNAVTPDWRLEQAMEKTFNLMNGGEIDIKKMGEFMKNVNLDILKEESDVIAAAGLIPKDIGSKVSERCRKYFIAKQNEAVGL